MALFEQCFWHGDHAPFGHSGATLRTCITQHQNRFRINVQILIVDDFFQICIAISNQCRACVFIEFRVASRRFNHSTIWRKIAFQHGKRALMINRVIKASNNIWMMHNGTFKTFTKRMAGNRYGIQFQFVAKIVHKGQNATGIKEIFHQIAFA